MWDRVRTFPVALTAIGVGGFTLRVGAVMGGYKNLPLGLDDNFWYHYQARLFAAHGDFLDPFYWANTGELRGSAGHPPLYPGLLGVATWLGFDSVLAHRIVSCVFGAAAVIVVGLVARHVARLAGFAGAGSDRAGLFAAGAAAVYPNLWINDGLILAESLYALAIAVVLLTAYRMWDEPTRGRAVALGVTLGLAALTRTEAAGLLLLLVVPLVLVLRHVTPKRRVGLLLVTGVAAGLTMSPWVALNMSRFEEPVALAAGTGRVLAYANCDRTYSGFFLGYWHTDCTLTDQVDGDESVVDVAHRRKALDYITDHWSDQPKVIAARVGRLWEVFRPIQGVEFNTLFERRGQWPSRAALAAYYLFTPAAIGGLVVLRKRGVTIVPLVAMAASVTLAAAVSFGITRYRVAAEVAIVVALGIALEAIHQWARAQRSRAEPASPS